MNPIAETEKPDADPFAADIFATPEQQFEASLATSEEIERALETQKRILWSERLPRVAGTAADWDDLWRNLSPIFFDDFAAQMADALTEILDLPREKAVEFSSFQRREINRAPDFSPENGWWFSVGNGEGDAAEIVVQIDDALAVSAIDAALDASGESRAPTVRPLTPTEAAVLEFFAVNMTYQANRLFGAPQFRFRAIGKQIPPLLRRAIESERFSLLVLESRTAMPPGVIKIYVAPEALQSLQSSKANRATGSLPNQVKDARARIACGEAQLTFGELAALESGDIVLPDADGFLTARGETLSGRVEIFLGDGGNVKITGELLFAGDESFEENAADEKVSVRHVNLNCLRQIAIESVHAIESAPLDKSMTETNDNLSDETAETDENFATDDGDNENGLAIENLIVSLRVELEARRLSLAEVGGLRENQTLELGVRPTDEVNILIDERVVGRGELVVVEDERLGVRITKLMR